jgi:ABC-2 type transport system ATP-binding protein
VRVALRDEGDFLARAEKTIAKIDGVIAVRKDPVAHGTLTFTVECLPERDLREEIARSLAAAGLPLLELYREELSLEEIFLQLVTEEVS